MTDVASFCEVEHNKALEPYSESGRFLQILHMVCACRKMTACTCRPKRALPMHLTTIQLFRWDLRLNSTCCRLRNVTLYCIATAAYDRLQPPASSQQQRDHPNPTMCSLIVSLAQVTAVQCGAMRCRSLHAHNRSRHVPKTRELRKSGVGQDRTDVGCGVK